MRNGGSLDRVERISLVGTIGEWKRTSTDAANGVFNDHCALVAFLVKLGNLFTFPPSSHTTIFLSIRVPPFATTRTKAHSLHPKSSDTRTISSHTLIIEFVVIRVMPETPGVPPKRPRSGWYECKVQGCQGGYEQTPSGGGSLPTITASTKALDS